MKKIVFLAIDCEATNILYHALKDQFPITDVIVEQTISRKTFLQRRIKKLGWITVFGQIAFQLLIVPYLKKKGKARNEIIKQTYQLNTSPIPKKLVHHVTSVNYSSTRKLLKTLQPDVVIVSGTRIIGRKTLGCIAAPFVNMHVGITPAYRGVHGGYWALVNNQMEACGVTIHLVDKGIDTGGILEQATIFPSKQDNFTTYPLLQIAAGIPLMKKAIQQILTQKNITTKPSLFPNLPSKVYYHPTIWQYILKGVS